MNAPVAGRRYKEKRVFPIKEVTDVEIAFPARIEGMIPEYENIPEEFKHGGTKWNRLFSDWFYSGVKDLQIIPKEGIDVKKALRHIRCIIGSFEPQHEHKEAGVAFLMNEWFEDARWKKIDRKLPGEK